MQKLLSLVNQSELCGGMGGLEIGEQNGEEQAHEGSYLVHKCPYSGLENVLFIQGSGPHVLHCDGQPGQSIKEIIVSRKCAESVLRGAQVWCLSPSLSLSAHQLLATTYTKCWAVGRSLLTISQLILSAKTAQLSRRTDEKQGRNLLEQQMLFHHNIATYAASHTNSATNALQATHN
jgi:hypothetical protein